MSEEKGPDDDDAEPGNWRKMAAELKRPVMNSTKPVTRKAVPAPATYEIADRQRQIREQLRSRRGIRPMNHAIEENAKYLHAPKLKRKWHFEFFWFLILVFFFFFLFLLRRRRKRKKGKRTTTTHKKKDLAEYFETIESGTIPPVVSGAARDNRGLRTVERFLRTAEPDIRDHTPPKRTLLQHGAAAGANQIVKACLKAGANPNIVDEAGDTALHLAAVAGSGSTVKLLLDAGAHPNIRDALGKLPADRAHDCDNKGCALLLARHMTRGAPSLTRPRKKNNAEASSSSAELLPGSSGLQQRRA